MPANPAPGWYADPADTSQHRFWDGKTWTTRIRPSDESIRFDDSPRSRGSRPGLWVGLGLLVIASVGGIIALTSNDTEPDSTPTPTHAADNPTPSPTTDPSEVVVPEGWILYTSETGVMSYAVDPNWEDLLGPGDQDSIHAYYSDGGITKSEYSGAWLLSGSEWTGGTGVQILSLATGQEPGLLRYQAKGFASSDVDDIEYLIDEEFTSTHGYDGWRLDYIATYDGIEYPESVIVLKAGVTLVFILGTSDEDFTEFAEGMQVLADSIVVHHPPAES
ncbi:MAG: DUF2510 domain-containing protein [Demequinaceae bacterium]|nr:DUF2510 domain-containing protein [Demequinaceae bacterium]